jgi:hypothetical protein
MKLPPVRRPVRAPVRDLLDAQLGTHGTTCACVFPIYAQHRSGPDDRQARTCASKISADVMLAAREPHYWRKICRSAVNKTVMIVLPFNVDAAIRHRIASKIS